MGHEKKPLEIDLQNKRVKVYRNLHNGAWSVLYKNKVVAHLDQVLLWDCKFHVCEPGRQRVISSGAKHVHAYVIGNFIDTPLAQAEAHQLQQSLRITYNPRKCGYFTIIGSDAPIYEASKVQLKENGIVFAKEAQTLL